jgi:hypothetical protein
MLVINNTYYYVGTNNKLYKLNLDAKSASLVYTFPSTYEDYYKVGNKHIFTCSSLSQTSEEYRITTVTSTNMTSFTKELSNKVLLDDVTNGGNCDIYLLTGGYVIVADAYYEEEDDDEDDIKHYLTCWNTTDFISWTKLWETSSSSGYWNRDTDMEYSNPINYTKGDLTYLDYGYDYDYESSNYWYKLKGYDLFAISSTGKNKIDDATYRMEKSGRDSYYLDTRTGPEEAKFYTYGDFAFSIFRDLEQDDPESSSTTIVEKEYYVHYGDEWERLGYEDMEDDDRDDDIDVYDRKFATVGKYLYYRDYTAPDGTLKINRLDGSTMNITTLINIENYTSGGIQSYKKDNIVYLKINTAAGFVYYRIINGSISSTSESVYIKNQKPTELVIPDEVNSEYEALGYKQKHVDSELAIYSNSANSSIKVIYENSVPAINVLAPSYNEIFGKNDTAVIPQISVSDPDNNALTCKYYIDGVQKETKTIASNTSTPQTVNFTAVNIGALSEDAHKMKFEVTDGFLITEETIDFTVDKTPPNISDLSAETTEKGMKITGIVSDTLAGLDDEPYNYTVTDGVNTWQSGWKAGTTHTQSSLQPNRNYTVKLEARDKVGNTAEEIITACTKAERPTVTTANVTTNSMDIVIGGNNPTNTQYSIAAGTKYVSSSGALASTEQWITLTNKRIKATGLTSNTSYKITAKAKNGAGEATLASAAAEGMTLPTAPENITAQPDKYFITLTWSAMPYITKYEVSADGEIESTGTETTYIHDDLIPNTQHSYKVRAVNAGGDGLWSDTLTAATLPDPPGIPINLRAEASQNEITLEWDAIEGAIDYDVEADGDLKENITGTTYIHSGLLSNTPHTYKVRARNRGGIGEWSDLLNKDTLPDPPGIPEEIEVTEITKDAITLTWDAADRAEGYDIEADGAIIDSTTNITYTHIGLAADTEYIYRIRARNMGGESDWTEETIVRTLPEKPGIPNNLTATAGTNEISLSWDNAERAVEYYVEAEGELIATISGTSYIHEGLEPDTQHTYRVKARNTGGESDYSATVTACTLSETTGMALTNVAAVVTNTSITLMWDAVAADTEYDVEVDGEIKDNEKNTTYIHSALQPVTSHTYKIRPKRGEEKGPWCAILAISTLPNPPDAPDNIKAIVTNTTIQLMWDKEEGATSYDIEIDGNDVVSTTDTMYIHEGLIPGTQHSYRIRAVNIAGVTPWSQAIEKSTIKPTYMIEAEAGEEYHIALAAMGMQEFKGRKLVLEYNPIEVEIIDLCEETREIELENGRIPGTNIIINHTAGRIEIEADKSIEPGKAWTGVMSTILIRSKVDGVINLDYLAE